MMLTATTSTRAKIPGRFAQGNAQRVQVKSRPLVPLNYAIVQLDVTAGQVRSYLDDGRLAGFNISVDQRGRACLRILPASLDHFERTAGKKSWDFSDWSKLFNLVFPFKQPTLRGLDVARTLSCDHGHVENLINAKLFHVAQPARPGPNGSPVITLASFELFLKERLVQ